MSSGRPMTTTTLSISQTEFVAAVTAAVRAPSMHNTQPWRFRLANGCIEVLADPLRRLPQGDPGGWALRLACGAATCNAQLALAVARIRTELIVRPDAAQPLLLARLRPVAHGDPSAEESALHGAIPRRYTNRLPFRDVPVPPEVRARLRAAAASRGAWLELLVGAVPAAVVAEIVWSADKALRRDPAYRSEQLAWSGRPPGATDGILASSAGLLTADDDILPMRDFSGAATRTGGQHYESEPVVAVLSSPGDTPHDQVAAGVAMQHLLLVAADAGLGASLLSQAIEVPAAREQLRLGLGGRGVPQIIARLGYGQPGEISPRRPVTEVIDS